jgi:hypothetical protein
MAYIPPVVTTGVYFTKNLTATNRTAGENLLSYYFRASKISRPPYYPVTNFADMLAWFDKNYPTYIESLGELTSTVEYGKLIQAMKDTAAKGYTDYPRPSYFSGPIVANTGVDLTSIVSGAISDSVDAIVNFSQGFLVVAIVGVGLFLYFEFKNDFKLIKGFKKLGKAVKA